MALINKRTIQNNWKLWAALGLTGLAALGVGLTCAFFPPAIPAIAGISIFGFKAFAGLTTMSVVAASFSGAGIAAAATLIGAGIVNGLTKVSNLFDNLFKTKKTHVTDFDNELVVRTGGFGKKSSTNVIGRHLHHHSSKKDEAANDQTARVVLEEQEADSRLHRRQPPTVTVQAPKEHSVQQEVRDLGTTSRTQTQTFYQPIPAVKKREVDVEVTEHDTLVVGGVGPK